MRPTSLGSHLKILALIARGFAPVGRREGSPCSPYGVFAEAEPRQKTDLKGAQTVSNIKIELNREGVRELLQSDWIMEQCREKAENALANLGEEYSVSSQVGANRVNVQVKAETYRARYHAIHDNSILKALGMMK